ncbi:hypothetical protein [Pseudokineococcus sp. 1T1Z-3]|uniref:hypothetical protein n=1 Tax=Pseudokineococcus sp. 1T1Z-3 TaxID=3132745 RepID=UPI0030A1B94F
MTEIDAEALDRMQRTLQGVLADLRYLEGRPPSEVREVLRGAVAEAGLPDQSESWVRDCSAELSAGRVVVIGPKEIPEEVQHLEPDPDQHASG